MKNEPIYLQIKEDIMNKIKAGIFLPGNYLPTEKELMQTYNASRGTIRKVIDTLEKDGAVIKKASVGACISYPKIEKGLTKLSGFTEDIIRRGGKPSCKSVSITLENPSEEVASSLKTNNKVYKISRVRCDNDFPVAREIAYVPQNLCPNLDKYDFKYDSLYEIIEERYHLPLHTAIQSVLPVKATKQDVLLLESDVDDLLLFTVRTCYMENGTPICCSHTWYRSDRYSFVVTLTK